MGAEHVVRRGGLARAPGLILMAACVLLPRTGGHAQEAANGEVQDTAVIAIEDQEIEAALRRVAERQDGLEEAIRRLEGRLVEVATATDATAARMARGNEPLVSLEIEQLWAMIGSLERENAILRERLDVLAPVPGE